MIGGLSVASWEPDLGEEAFGPASTSFGASVTEQECASGQPLGDRLHPPRVTYGPTDIVIQFVADPLPGQHDCVGNPAASVQIELTEPIRNRRLLDGSVVPPAERFWGFE